MNAQMMRENAENCLMLASASESTPAKNRYLRMAKAWLTLAENKDWLDGALAPDHAPPIQAQL